MVRRDGGGWKIEVADDWQRPMWGGSSSRGTGEPCLGDTGELSLRAYGRVARFLAAKYGRLLSIRDVRQGHDAISCVCVCLFSLVAPRSQLGIIDQVGFLTCN